MKLILRFSAPWRVRGSGWLSGKADVPAWAWWVLALAAFALLLAEVLDA